MPKKKARRRTTRQGDSGRSTNRLDGRSPDGRFIAGNKGGPGNPSAGKVQKLRNSLLDAVSQADIKRAIKKLVRMGVAKNGDVQALKLLFERVLGPPVAHDFEARLAEIERRIGVSQD